MGIGGITNVAIANANATATAEAVPAAEAVAQAVAQAPVADTFTPSNPDLSIPDLGQIHEPTSAAYHDLVAAKRELHHARSEPTGNGHRRADIREAKRDVRQAKAALNAETSGAGSAGLTKDTFGTAAPAGLRPVTADDFKNGVDTKLLGEGVVKTGWGQNGNGKALGHHLPEISQLHPQGEDGNYDNGDMNCAPAALAMIAREHPDMMLNGNPVGAYTDAQLINAIGQHAQTNFQGTSPNGLIAAAEDMGFQTAARQGGYNANFIDGVLAQGGSVVANGAYFIDDQLAGHFVTVAAKNQDGTYTVNDPLQGRVTWTADELNRFLLANPNNHGVSIGIF